MEILKVISLFSGTFLSDVMRNLTPKIIVYFMMEKFPWLADIEMQTSRQGKFLFFPESDENSIRTKNQFLVTTSILYFNTRNNTEGIAKRKK